MSGDVPPAVYELSDPYSSYLIQPRHGAGICKGCLTFVEPPYERCYPCGENGWRLAASTVISYSHSEGQLHATLRAYKSQFGGHGVRQRQYEVTALIWRHLATHEACLASDSGVESFPVVTTVPSSAPARDAGHPLPTIVGSWIKHTADRYRRLLTPTGRGEPHRFHPERFQGLETLDGEPVLVVDDTWTAGANAYSAAAALTAIGAGPVAILAVARYVRTHERDYRTRLNAIRGPFDWELCALHTTR